MKLILPKTNVLSIKQILDKNTKNEINKPFKHYFTVCEFSEKQTAAILEKEMSILHELKLLQCQLSVTYGKITTTNIYNMIKSRGKRNRLDYEWYEYETINFTNIKKTDFFIIYLIFFISLSKFLKNLRVDYSLDEFSALMRKINAEDNTHLKRTDIVKLFFLDKLSEIPSNFTRLTSQRRMNKECFSKFNENLMRINQNNNKKKEAVQTIRKKTNESDYWKEIKLSRKIFLNKIDYCNSDNFHNYLPLSSIGKEVDLRKESLKKLQSYRKFDREPNNQNPFCLSYDYYKQYDNN